MDKNTLEETDKRDGKVISVQRIALSADGKNLTITVEDKLQGTTPGPMRADPAISRRSKV